MCGATWLGGRQLVSRGCYYSVTMVANLPGCRNPGKRQAPFVG